MGVRRRQARQDLRRRDEPLAAIRIHGTPAELPTFGGPSEKEAQSGLGNHGEALVVEWKKDAAITSADAVQLVYSAYLPKTQYNVGRTLTLIDRESVMYVEEWVENLLAFGRPAHWVQHATFGPPFVEPGKNVLDASATRGEVRGPTSPNRMLARGSIDWPWGTSPKDVESVCARCRTGRNPVSTTRC